MKIIILAMFFCASFFFTSNLYAQENITSPTSEIVSSPSILQVSTIVREPFVIQNGDELTGFSIELWNIIAKRNQWEYEYQLTDQFVQLLGSVREPVTADAAIANISITSEREKVMDFSSAIFDGGLQILVPFKQTKDHVIDSFFSPKALYLLGVLLVSFVVISQLISRKTEQFRSYVGAYTYVASMGQYYKGMHPNIETRTSVLVWNLLLVVFVMFITFEITRTTQLTQSGLQITNDQDLQGKLVGVTAGSTAENYMRTNNITTVSFNTIDELFREVSQGNIDAAVHDAPVVQHYVTYTGQGKVVVVGEIFNRESYGVALPTDSPLKEKINTTLLQLKEDGTYDNLLERWFER